ncbi:MAG: hypothetical protein AB1782_18295 [Cyanobacteriota bacterium]
MSGWWKPRSILTTFVFLIIAAVLVALPIIYLTIRDNKSVDSTQNNYKTQTIYNKTEDNNKKIKSTIDKKPALKNTLEDKITDLNSDDVELEKSNNHIEAKQLSLGYSIMHCNTNECKKLKAEWFKKLKELYNIKYQVIEYTKNITDESLKETYNYLMELNSLDRFYNNPDDNIFIEHMLEKIHLLDTLINITASKNQKVKNIKEKCQPLELELKELEKKLKEAAYESIISKTAS